MEAKYFPLGVLEMVTFFYFTFYFSVYPTFNTLSELTYKKSVAIN